MSTRRALLYALGVTVVSVIMLTISRGLPTQAQLVNTSAEMFVVAFIVMKFFYSSVKRQDKSNEE